MPAIELVHGSRAQPGRHEGCSHAAVVNWAAVAQLHALIYPGRGDGAGGVLRVRSHHRFRNRGTDYVSESGMKWMSGGTKRQCDRALGVLPPALLLRLVPLALDVKVILTPPCKFH